MKATRTYLKNLVYKVNGAAIEVHKVLGPGLLESVYHKCMEIELTLRGINYKSEFIIPIEYKDHILDANFKCDFFIEDILILEIKAVKEVLPIHEAILLNYMNLMEVPKGLMINFNVTNIFYDGQKTYVNDLFRDLPE
jgi:GxxExxY protein